MLAAIPVRRVYAHHFIRRLFTPVKSVMHISGYVYVEELCALCQHTCGGACSGIHKRRAMFTMASGKIILD